MLDLFVRTIYNKCAHGKEVKRMAPTQGRPPIDNPKSERLYIRVTPDEKAEIQAITKETGLTLLDLIRAGIQAVTKKN